MKVVLLLVTSVLLGSSQALTFRTPQPSRAGVVNRTLTAGRKTSLTFIGTVKSIEPLGKQELSLIPVDFDPRFAVTVHIESMSAQEGPLQVGVDQVLAIHSAARLFRTDIKDVILKRYRFKVRREKRGDKGRLFALTAMLMEDKGALSK